jgi:DNA segregation ATPase FtsK/SpoIIIE-like protein
VATEVDQAESRLARILAEMDRRRVLFARAGAKSLAAYNRHSSAPLPLLLLIVDEVTDIALQAGLKSAFYKDLIRLVSKGRAFGLVVVLATQNPKAEVLNTLIRGNMSTRIAFRVSTVEHSRTILGVGGAQELPRTIRGRLMARLDSELVTLQGFHITDDKIQALAAGLRSRPVQVLTDLERELVQYAVEHLDSKFNTNKLWPVFRDRIGRDALLALARRWQKRGWLAEQPGVNAPRRVADELCQLVPPKAKGRVGEKNALLPTLPTLPILAACSCQTTVRLGVWQPGGLRRSGEI